MARLPATRRPPRRITQRRPRPRRPRKQPRLRLLLRPRPCPAASRRAHRQARSARRGSRKRCGDDRRQGGRRRLGARLRRLLADRLRRRRQRDHHARPLPLEQARPLRAARARRRGAPRGHLAPDRCRAQRPLQRGLRRDLLHSRSRAPGSTISEVELGPFGHFFDIEIDRQSGKQNTAWSSGARIATTRNAAARTAVIEVELTAPEILAALAAGARLPLGLYRMEGTGDRHYSRGARRERRSPISTYPRPSAPSSSIRAEAPRSPREPC